MTRVLIADDHPLFREAIRNVIACLLEGEGGGFTCLEATDAEGLARATEAAGDDLDLILLDLFMPGADGMAHLVALRRRVPQTPVVVISAREDGATVRQAITCGAAGFIPKSAPKEQIATALRVVFAGGIYLPPGLATDEPAVEPSGSELTPRQIAVLELIVQGKSNKQIAHELAISEMTVKAHVTAVLRKLGVFSRAQAIVRFRNLVS
ncbi:Glycerol metabolism activator [Rhodovastum atsumiense]|uniref:Response regulator transcription factor n=1 Tax=Rhodovastum atsumiense TaxID=504468 RepID=A0A5M6IK52_9PROT|nr:response regulator transcription factor [Rhodovastum atsumiense]KAA5608065.1 response regulator transcription factor [Rhodovastum atsumiense]CAH2602625.1 Glycerol metabolism activator [Rhodovastum atsumiense]